MKLGIIIYSDHAETVWNACRLANFSLNKGNHVKVFLMAKGVEAESLTTKDFNIKDLLEKFLKLHIEHQIKNGATIIQIFDSWAGLLDEKDLPNYVYIPTLNLVEYIGFDVDKVRKKVKDKSIVFLEGEEILIEYQNHLERLDNDIKLIPFLYSINPYE